MAPPALDSVIAGVVGVASAGIDAALLLGTALAGLAVGAALGAAVTVALGRRASPAEDVIRRRPSPSSVGLDDDPIVAALVGPRASGTRRRRLPGDEDPLT